MNGYFIVQFFFAGDVFRRNRRNSRRDRAVTVCQNPGATFQADSQVCVQSSLPGEYNNINIVIPYYDIVLN